MKNFALAFLGVLFFFFSCRSETDFISFEKETKETSRKFSIFSKNSINAKNSNSLDYAKSFAYLAERYDSINKTNVTGLVNSVNKVSYNKSTKLRFIAQASDFYIEFRLHSQTIFEENGDKWVLFPKVKNGKVIDLVATLLTENETKVYYPTINRNSTLFKEHINLFETQFNKHFMTDEKGNVYRIATTSKCFDPAAPCDIQEIIVYPPPKSGGGNNGGGIIGSGDPAPPGGGCPAHQMCLDDGTGGGGGSSDTNTTTNPCENIKTLTSSQTYKDNKAILFQRTNDIAEHGFRVGLPITSAGQTGTQYQKLSNSIGTNQLDFRIFSTTFGIMHSHYDGLYPIFSPDDIIVFGELLKNAQNNNIPLSKVFLSVVTSSGNYQLRYEGTGFVGFSGTLDMNNLNASYISYLGNSGDQQKYEEGFLKFMRDKMNIAGAKLYKEGDSGNSELKLENNSLANSVPCK